MPPRPRTEKHRHASPPRPARAAALAPLTPAPALWRDPWALAAVASLLPLLVRCMGAPLGEAVAEDFDFLRRALLDGMGTLLDGGGSSAFWRPVAHQLYYAVFGPLIVTHPGAVAALHAAMLALATLLVYRALRTVLPGSLAASAASFPMLAESTRTLVGWPSHFVDLGLYLFVAIAFHDVSRRRTATALVALVLALLCKEVAIVAGVLLPLAPFPRTRDERLRTGGAFAVTLAIWAAVYLTVRHAAHLQLPHGIESDAQLLATPLWARLLWALVGSLRAILSLMIVPDPHDWIAAGLSILAPLALLVGLALSPIARARLHALRYWALWGLAWFLLATATLTPIFPLWQPNRSHFGSTGLGVASSVALGAVHPALPWALAAGRTTLLALAPPAAERITSEPPKSGAFMDFAQLTRLQRFMRATRTTLHATYPVMPKGAVVLDVNLPRGLSYALGGDHAMQVWYRDTTLRMMPWSAYRRQRIPQAFSVIQYQNDRAREIVLIPPDGMADQDQAYHEITAGDPSRCFALLAHADSIAPDTGLSVYHGSTAGLRAFALYTMQRYDSAQAEARRALTMFRLDFNGRIILASTLLMKRKLDDAEPVIESLERTHANDPTTHKLRAEYDRMRGIRRM